MQGMRHCVATGRKLRKHLNHNCVKTGQVDSDLFMNFQRQCQ